MKHKVEIKETLSRIIEIEAENVDGAMKEAKRKYADENIVLNAEDYIDTEIKLYH